MSWFLEIMIPEPVFFVDIGYIIYGEGWSKCQGTAGGHHIAGDLMVGNHRKTIGKP